MTEVPHYNSDITTIGRLLFSLINLLNYLICITNGIWFLTDGVNLRKTYPIYKCQLWEPAKHYGLSQSVY